MIYNYNQQIRAYAQANNKLLFDLADIESHQANGSACVSGSFDVQCPEWSLDGGHLNDVGSLRAAKAYWYLMARLAGWNGVG
jgi:hypothetical protein